MSDTERACAVDTSDQFVLNFHANILICDLWHNDVWNHKQNVKYLKLRKHEAPHLSVKPSDGTIAIWVSVYKYSKSYFSFLNILNTIFYTISSEYHQIYDAKLKMEFQFFFQYHLKSSNIWRKIDDKSDHSVRINKDKSLQSTHQSY